MGYFRVLKYNEADELIKETLMKRSFDEIVKIKPDVERIVEDVKNNGDRAILEYLESQWKRKISPAELRVERSRLKESYESMSDELRGSLEHMIKNVMKFHEAQMPKAFQMDVEDGVTAGMFFSPVKRAGLYVPSGKGSFPSVAVMVAVPAIVAGVKEIAMASPPVDPSMNIDRATAAVAYMLELREVYAVGGAHAVAAFAFGTETIPRVDVIAGPGGPYTFLAKAIVSLYVRTDLPAGPSEGMILSDGNADPEVVAWNLLNEAEHGPDSAGIMVTDDLEFARRVAEIADRLIDELPEPRRSFMRENTKKYSAIIVFDSLEKAAEFVGEYAPEHLAIESRNAEEIFSRFKDVLRAGTITFYTPFSAGNYGIGPNSTLPTFGFARSYSGLTVYNFLVSTTTEKLSRAGWERIRDMVLTLASYEGFPSHYMAMKVSEKRWVR